MRNLNQIGLLTGIALAVGMIGVNIADGTFTVSDKTSDVYQETGMFSGHLEIIHTDADGNILTYLQTDNAIISKGENCAAQDLFGGTAGGTSATSTFCPSDPGIFDWIALTDIAAAGLDDLVLTGELTAGGLNRAQASSVAATQVAIGATTDNITRLSVTFTNTGASQDVTGSGLFNQTTLVGSAIFAQKDFGTSVTLATSDQLTVNWDITTGGNDVF